MQIHRPPYFEHKGAVWLAAYDREGNRILTCGSTDGLARVWDARSGALLVSLPQAEAVYDGGFCGDGSRVVVSCRKTVHLWDLKTRREVVPPAAHSNHINFIEISPDGRLLLIGQPGWNGTGLEHGGPATGHPASDRWLDRSFMPA